MRFENFSNIRSNQCFLKSNLYFNYCLAQKVYKFLLLIKKQVHLILAHLHLTNLTFLMISTTLKRQYQNNNKNVK